MPAATRAGTSARKRIKRPESFDTRARQEWVPISKLFSDPDYQRPVDMDRVRSMALQFNPDALGSILVSKRPDGNYAVLDGFHRVSMLRLFGWDDQKMPATTYLGLSKQEEAELFRIVNQDRTKPKPLALFKARVASGDKDAVELASVLNQLGLSYDSYSAVRGGVRAIDTIQRVQEACGLDVVRKAMTVMTQAWGQDPEALNGEVFKGISLLLFHYGDKVDLANLSSKLKDTHPNNVRTRARTMKEIMPEWQASSCVAAVIVTAYNFRLREQHRLPAWEGQTFPRKAMQRNGKAS